MNQTGAESPAGRNMRLRGELRCCSAWVPYPVPGRDTQCPVCGSVFTIPMTPARAAGLWAIAFTAWERRLSRLGITWCVHEGPRIHPAEVLAAGLITPADFLNSLQS